MKSKFLTILRDFILALFIIYFGVKALTIVIPIIVPHS